MNLCAISSLLCTLAFLAPATTAAPRDPAAAIDSYLTGLAARDTFSGAVLVAVRNRILVSKGYGFANRSAHLRNTPLTKYRISWLGNELNHAAILRLADQGKLDVSGSLCTYVPRCPRGWRGYSVSSILRGKGSIDVPPGTPPTGYQTLEAWMAHLRTQAINPRHDNSYTNELLFAYLVERLSGASWQSYVRAQVIAPAAMTQTTFAGPTSAPGSALPYVLGDSGAFARTYWDRGRGVPSEQLVSTTLDFGRFDQAAYDGTLLSPASELLLDHARDEARDDNINNARGARGWDTLYARQAGDIVILLFSNTNGSPLHDIAGAISQLVHDPARRLQLSSPRALPLPEREAAAFVGRYSGLFRENSNYQFTVGFRNGGLVLSPSPIGTTDTGAERLLRIGQTRFALVRAPRYAIRFTGSGAPSSAADGFTLDIAFDDGRRNHAEFLRHSK